MSRAAQQARMEAASLADLRPWLDAARIKAARDQAWLRYLNYPHADIDVGWKRYRAEIDAINALEERR